MSATERIPGMVPGRTGRNVGVAVMYFVLIVIVIGLLPLVAAATVGTSFRGSADRLAALPGIAAGGGLKSGGVAFVYGFVIIGVIGAATGGGDSPSDSGVGGEAAVPATQVTAAPTTSPTPTHAASPTPSATAFPSPTQAARGPQEGSEWTVTITRVIDGDTVEARFLNGEIDTLRLLGVDTTETTYSRNDPSEWEGIPDTTASLDHLFNWGEKASDFTSDSLARKMVRVEVDPEADRRGSFGRLLVYLYVNGENFNKRLITEGYARVYESSFSKRSGFDVAEDKAQTNNVGLWEFEVSSPTPSPTTTDTETLGDEGKLDIVEIHVDAAGNDHENENDEYIVFKNSGDDPLDLSGWRVEDEADHTYYFPSGFTLDPGSRVTLFTGSGENTDTELYWGSNSAIWNNDGDTIYVYDDNGTKVIERPYSIPATARPTFSDHSV